MRRFHFNNRLFLSALLAVSCQIQLFAYKTHHVVDNESLWGLARRYNVTVEQLIAANPSLEKGLKAGTDIRIPEPEDLAAPESVSEASEPENQTQSHIVRINRDRSGSYETKTVTDNRIDPEQKDKTRESVALNNINYFDNLGAAQKPERDPSSSGYYISSFGDSFATISKKTGVPSETLIRLNPFIEDTTIPEGTLVRISSMPLSNVEDRTLTLVDSIELRILEIPVVTDLQDTENTDIVVVALPFESETTSLSKQSLHATEFYKGLLLAFNSGISSGIVSPMKIVAIDSKEGTDKVINQIKELNLNSSAIIIPADDETLLSAIANSGTDAAVLNVLSIRDGSYTDNPRVIQCNINQPLMYDKAAAYITTNLDGYTPVILNPAGGASEKSGFIDQLRKKCADLGIEVIDLNFSNKLTDKDLAKLSKVKKYVFIPKSGNADVFERFSSALSAYFAADTQFDRLKLFGYPDWVIMKGSNEEALHNMNALIYSRFNFDEQNLDIKDILDSYRKWYGAPMAKAFPMQALLGYDAGNLIIHSRANRHAESAKERFEGNSYEGQQSAFHFIHDNSQGLVNNALYIIEYMPGQTCFIRVI